VKSGQRIGLLHEFERVDDAPVELRAPHDGIVICLAWVAKVMAGQVVAQLGKPVPWAR
jgi:predicted deacylase